MTTVFDYIRWRGDLTFRQDPFNVVDAIVFSSLAYLRHAGRAAQAPNTPLLLREAAAEFLQLPDCKERCRHQTDLDLVKAVISSHRFGDAYLMEYREQYIPEEDTQFAAGTYLLDDETMVIAFRGTDNNLVGWKEDFNMSFRQTVPAQLLAQEYLHRIYTCYGNAMHLCGHSKGGNLAMFSAARIGPMIQEGILDVYNLDGPGFSDYLMGDPGYLAMVSRIHTYVPQSSVIGMLMDHEEPIHIIRSNAISGLLQHDTFSWEVVGKSLTPVNELTTDAKFIRATTENWLQETDPEQRNQFVEAVFTLLGYGTVEKTGDLLSLKKLHDYIKLYGSDENLQKTVGSEISNILRAAKKSRTQMGNAQPKQIEEET